MGQYFNTLEKVLRKLQKYLYSRLSPADKEVVLSFVPSVKPENEVCWIRHTLIEIEIINNFKVVEVTVGVWAP